MRWEEKSKPAYPQQVLKLKMAWAWPRMLKMDVMRPSQLKRNQILFKFTSWLFTVHQVDNSCYLCLLLFTFDFLQLHFQFVTWILIDSNRVEKETKIINISLKLFQSYSFDFKCIDQCAVCIKIYFFIIYTLQLMRSICGQQTHSYEKCQSISKYSRKALHPPPPPPSIHYWYIHWCLFYSWDLNTLIGFKCNTNGMVKDTSILNFLKTHN